MQKLFKSHMEEQLHNLIKSIKPFDAIERTQIDETLAWIESGASLFRIQKPNLPDKHLVSYFVLIDTSCNKILLVDHKSAKLWLPSGGHVEIDEDPKDTVRRECLEELNVEADFLIEDPIFLTTTLTNSLIGQHTDVSLWYVLRGNSLATYQFDTSEFHDIRWYNFEEIPYEKSDPNMKRFIEKLKSLL